MTEPTYAWKHRAKAAEARIRDLEARLDNEIELSRFWKAEAEHRFAQVEAADRLADAVETHARVRGDEKLRCSFCENQAAAYRSLRSTRTREGKE